MRKSIFLIFYITPLEKFSKCAVMYDDVTRRIKSVKKPIVPFSKCIERVTRKRPKQSVHFGTVIGRTRLTKLTIKTSSKLSLYRTSFWTVSRDPANPIEKLVHRSGDVKCSFFFNGRANAD